MKKRTISVMTVVMIALLTAVATFNITFFASADYYSKRLGRLQDDEDRFAKLQEVAETVEKYFIGEYDEADALETAAAGYIVGLGDRWSVYCTAEETAALIEEDANTYVGVGLTYSTEPGSAYTVTSVSAHSPAANAGIMVGDVIIAVDGTPVDQLAEEPADLVNVVKGEEGTPVQLTVRRGEEELVFDLERASVYNEGVTAEMLDGRIAYMSIEGFESNVDVEFAEKLQALMDQGAKALIVDVRWNPGGYLEVMRNMLDLLLPEGVVISTVDNQDHVREYTSDASCLGIPTAVIVNANSISAAEFFAAAVQEYGVGAVVGGHTGGKGYSQQMIMLSDGSSIHLSTTRYYTPKGNNLAGVGVTPDYPVEMEMDYTEFYYLDRAEDVQLQKAIEVVAAQIPAEEPPAEDAPTEDTPAEDAAQLPAA